MSATSLILVVATVISVQAGTANLDRGRQDGLEPGDRGQIYYQLTVAGRPHRIEVGEASITAVDISMATLTIPADLTVRAGYRFEAHIPAARLDALKRPASVPAETVEMLPTAVVPAAEGSAETQTTPPETPTEADPIVESALIAVLIDEGDETPVEAIPTPDTLYTGMILIPSGQYTIGLDLPDAEFFSQTPRFTVDLPAFWIDRHPTSERNLTYAQAQAHCRDQGKRLPTEIEWEIGVQSTEVSSRPGLLEWTTSWYQPYPGNTRPEDEFGQRFRVLRGSTGATDLDPHARRYLEPTNRNPGVGFRCALDQP